MKEKFVCIVKRLLVIVGLVLLFLGVETQVAYAEEESKLPEDYTNVLSNMNPNMFGTCRTSFMDRLEEGGYQTVIYYNGVLYIENYDDNLEPVSAKQIALELPLWGGFYSGKEYNYVVCGNYYDNEAEDGGTVYRIIKYDKEFNRLDSNSFSGVQTYTATPFDAGNLSIDESGNLLTVYTSRLRLDGHQSNIAFLINTDGMSLIDASGLSKFPDIHVSHSLRQIFKYDIDMPVYVDLSDASPERSVYIQYKNEQIGYIGKALVPISGQSGYNVTNAEVSGLEISDTHYLVVGTYLKQSVSNVYLACIEKESGKVTRQWLTGTTRFVPKYQHNPRITQIADNRFVVFWGAKFADEQSVKYVIVNESGEAVSEIKEVAGAGITDCEPIYDGNKILWLSVKNGETSFEELSNFEETGIFELEDSLVEPVNPWDATVDTSWYNNTATSFNISTPQQLAGLASLVNGGNDFLGKTVNLVNDIFLNDNTYSNVWVPMENWQGTFHGNGNTIYNMYTDGSTWGGLFNTIGENGIVKAVNLSQGILNGGGSVADYNYGIIAFCNNRSQVNCEYDFSGSICNRNHNLVYGCKNYGVVSGESVGGIVGLNGETFSTVSQCANLGMVSSTSMGGGGIVETNHGWIYNCYNRGILTDTCPGSLFNRADSLSGIANYSSSGNHIESCYTAGAFEYSESIRNGAHAIVYDGKWEEVLNCYTKPMPGYKNYYSSEAKTIQVAQMKKASFVDKLNVQTLTVLPAWTTDKDNINGGFPITLAEYNAGRGVYKIQPELWMTNEKQMVMAVGAQETITYKCYFNEKAPVISSEDTSVARVTDTNNTITIEAVGKGTTYLSIRFAETENNIAQTYQIAIIVNETGELENPFSDVPNDKWYYPYVLKAYNRGLVSGVSTDKTTGLVQFAPEAKITREQFVQILYSLEGKPKVEYKAIFTDVPEQSDTVWYSNAIMWASQNNVVAGYESGKFGVGDNITREQVATMLMAYAQYKGYATTEKADLSGFKDVNDISGYAVENMKWAVSYGIMAGNDQGYLMPKGNSTRAEATTMLLGMLVAYE